MEQIAKKCHMIVRVLEFIETRPDGISLLEQCMRDGRLLYGVEDVSSWTGWSASWIRKLCEMNKIPHIPGKKLKFVRSDVIQALRKMQKGGDYGKRKRKVN